MSAKTNDPWDTRARNLLKGELVRRGLSYDDLVLKLKKIGVEDNANNLRSKINRGTFSATFLLQALQAIGCKSLDINLD
jgi:hypothetical protein